MKTFASTAVLAACAFALAACASTPGSVDSSIPADASSAATSPATVTEYPMSTSPEPATGFTVTSPDFADGEDLADSATASAFGGQCSGDNLNPALEWSGAPDGTASFLIIMVDESAGSWVHWIHADIPADVTNVTTGGSATLAGAAGANWGDSSGYFGPCPPGPDHRYVFTVYALDSVLGLAPDFTYYDLLPAMKDHVLAQASITGMRSGPA